MGPIAGLDAVTKRKILCCCQEQTHSLPALNPFLLSDHTWLIFSTFFFSDQPFWMYHFPSPQTVKTVYVYINRTRVSKFLATEEVLWVVVAREGAVLLSMRTPPIPIPNTLRAKKFPVVQCIGRAHPCSSGQ
jgi:hypothetical protein